MLQKLACVLYSLLTLPAVISHNTGEVLAPQSHIEPGVYQHYKGGYYLVLFVAQNTETEDEEVVYQSLSGDLRVWTRPLQMFLENVEHEGNSVQRFRKIATADKAESFITLKVQ